MGSVRGFFSESATELTLSLVPKYEAKKREGPGQGTRGRPPGAPSGRGSVPRESTGSPAGDASQPSDCIKLILCPDAPNPRRPQGFCDCGGASVRIFGIIILTVVCEFMLLIFAAHLCPVFPSDLFRCISHACLCSKFEIRLLLITRRKIVWCFCRFVWCYVFFLRMGQRI